MEPQKSTKPSMESLNVLQKPLAQFEKSPPTGFYRDGYCRSGPEDKGNHAVAGVVTDEFLDFTASRGNDLRAEPAKLSNGQKWCLCTHRWKEALDAFKQGQVKETGVPKVYLHATDKSALGKLRYEDLKRFAADGDAVHEGGSRQDSSITPSSRAGAAVKEV